MNLQVLERVLRLRDFGWLRGVMAGKLWISEGMGAVTLRIAERYGGSKITDEGHVWGL